MSNYERLACFADFRAAARARLPRILFDYIDGGSYAEATLARNAQAWQNIMLRQRVMVDVAEPQSRVELLGQSLAFPLMLAPVGFAGMYARRGEVQAAAAARDAGVPFCLSTVGICSIEEVAEGAGTPPWFQLYLIKDRGVTRELLQRAAAASCPALVLTADLQTPGSRYRDVRSGMMRRPTMLDWLKRGIEGMSKIGWTADVYLSGHPHAFGNLGTALPKAASFNEAWEWISANLDPAVTWQDLDFVRQHWSGPILLKGVMTADDAALARQWGIDAIIASNHGGRQLDGSPAAIEVVPELVAAVGDALPILCDGGVQSGLDVLRARKVGATAGLIGKAWAFALAAGGQQGVARLLATMKAEYRTGQMLTAQLQ